VFLRPLAGSQRLDQAFIQAPGVLVINILQRGVMSQLGPAQPARQAAARALAFKWIRILYRCWQTRTPYDELTYLEALRRRDSPLLDQLSAMAETT
jgi:hypothetical protein